MNNKINTRKLVMLALLAGILFLMAFTPLGYLRIGPLSITFNTIPVAIGAIALGPVCGAVLGAVFGLTSVMGGSALVMTLMSINPFLAGIMCFVPRILEGLFAGLIAKGFSKTSVLKPVSYGITGLMTAFLNTLFFMSALVLLFKDAAPVRNMAQNIITNNYFKYLIAICAPIILNIVIECASTAVVSSAVGTALHKAKLI